MPTADMALSLRAAHLRSHLARIENAIALALYVGSDVIRLRVSAIALSQ